MNTFSAYEHMERPKNPSVPRERKAEGKMEQTLILFAKEYLRTNDDPAKKNVYRFLTETPSNEVPLYEAETGRQELPTPMERIAWLASKLPARHPARRPWDVIDRLSEREKNKVWSNAVVMTRPKK